MLNHIQKKSNFLPFLSMSPLSPYKYESNKNCISLVMPYFSDFSLILTGLLFSLLNEVELLKLYGI